jgi:hypothetical protein
MFDKVNNLSNISENLMHRKFLFAYFNNFIFGLLFNLYFLEFCFMSYTYEKKKVRIYNYNFFLYKYLKIKFVFSE